MFNFFAGLLTGFFPAHFIQPLQIQSRPLLNIGKGCLPIGRYDLADGLAILIDSVEPRRQELLRRLNRVAGATNELVKMRALLLKACIQEKELRRIDVDFQPS